MSLCSTSPPLTLLTLHNTRRRNSVSNCSSNSRLAVTWQHDLKRMVPSRVCLCDLYYPAWWLFGSFTNEDTLNSLTNDRSSPENDTTDCKFLPEQATQCFHSRHRVDRRWSRVSAWWLLYQRAWLVQLTGEPTSQWTPTEKSSSLNGSSPGCSPINPLTSIQCQCGSKCGPLTFGWPLVARTIPRSAWTDDMNILIVWDSCDTVDIIR